MASSMTSLKMNDKTESDSRVFLGNFIAAMMSPDIDRQVTFFLNVGPGLDQTGNLDLFGHL